MPLKIQPTNRPKIGLDGYCKGKVTNVEAIEESEDITFPSLKWTLESEGLLRPMTHHFFTPQSYNIDIQIPEDDSDGNLPVFENFGDGRLSILANLLKQLEFLNEFTIEQLREGEVNQEEVEFDIEEIYEVPLRYKFVRVNGAYRINRATIERLAI